MNQFQISEMSTVRSPLRGNVEILVFKTNLTDTKRISDIESLLDIHPNIIEWNVDLDDCDNVLRIVSRDIVAQEVETLLLNAGYYCEELQ